MSNRTRVSYLSAGLPFQVALIAALSLGIGVILLAASGCSVLTPKETRKPKTTNAVVLLDLSGSTKSESTRDQYARDLERVVSRLYYGDVLSVWSIDKDSIKNSVALNDDAPFPVLTFEKETSTYDKRRLSKEFIAKNPIESARAASLESAAGHLKEVTKGSDLLGAMEIASRQFELNNSSEKWLIIFSDMLISDGRLTMYKPFEADAMLKEVRESEGIPPLTNVNVIVVGAGAADKAQWKKVRAFWLAYFEEAGASVPPAHYGTQLPSELVDRINAGEDVTAGDPQRLGK